MCNFATIFFCNSITLVYSEVYSDLFDAFCCILPTKHWLNVLPKF